MVTKAKETRTARSLYTTLTFAFVVLSVVALLFSGVLQLISNLQTQETVISGYQQLIAQQAAVSVSNFIQEKFRVLETAIWLTDPVTQSKEDQKVILESLLGLQPAFRQLVVFDSQNKALAQASRLPRQTPDPFLKMVSEDILPQIQEGKQYISPVYLDPNTNEPLIVMATPVFDVFDEYQGLILAEANLKFMWDLVENLKVGKSGHAYVVDRSGSLLAYADIALVLKGESMNRIKLVRDFMNNPSSIRPNEASTYRGITGNLVVGSYVPLQMPDWAVITELPWEEAYQSVMINSALAILITIAVALLAVLVASTLARRLAVPLENLMETATQISEGNRELQAEVSGPTEVASLALAFNNMTSQLRQTLANLEQKVAERTQQLQDTLKFQEEILSSSATGIVAYDDTGQCVLVNEATAKLVNATTKQLLAQNYHHIESWKKSGLYESALEAFNQRKEIEKEIFMTTSFGKDAWFNCRFTSFESGGRRHLLLTVNDMTDHKRIEQEILNLNQKLRVQATNLSVANKELEAFSYSVSHDLRAPLRAINGFTNILLEDYAINLDEVGKRVCNIIRENTQRMSQLIDDLLSFSRLSRTEMQTFPIDIADLVNSVFRELTAHLDQLRIHLKIDTLPDAMGDPMLIHQVWTNLISNAIKFSAKREQPYIEIGSQSTETEVVYYIKDNGAGFDMQYAEKLFGVFQRLHSEQEFEGTGVGLAIVQRIIHRHGGRIWGEGNVDQGATFYFSLPKKAIQS